MSAPGVVNGSIVGQTVGGISVTEIEDGNFQVPSQTVNVSVNGALIPDNSYTYVGDINGSAYQNPVFYSNVTGLYFIPSLDDTPPNGVAVGYVENDDAGLYQTHLQNGVDSTYDYSTQIEVVTPCFCSGTLITIPSGQVLVERLAIGDVVVTASGAHRLVKWIGCRSYSARFVAGRRELLPVCVKAGALDGMLPSRDLWISPLHALFLDDVLVPVGLLVNELSILQPTAAFDVRYFHIELESHDVVLAEGAAAESFLDDSSRGMFQNAHEYAVLYPNKIVAPARFCATRVESGYALDSIRHRINALVGLRVEREKAGSLRGSLELATLSFVRGWAQDSANVEAAVCLDVVVNGRCIAQTLANQFRPDLLAAGIGSGRHGFEVCFSLAETFNANVSANIELRRSSDGAMLSKVPKMVA